MSFSQSHWELLEMLQLWSLGSETLGVSEHKYLVVFFPSSAWILQYCFVLLNTCFHQCALKYILIKRQKVNRWRLECQWSRGGRVSHVSHQVFYNIPLGIFCVWPLPNKRKRAQRLLYPAVFTLSCAHHIPYFLTVYFFLSCTCTSRSGDKR